MRLKVHFVLRVVLRIKASESLFEFKIKIYKYLSDIGYLGDILW